uniref:CSON008904 protein n=1 Tax=Culicoides sonorensis TaxID=179676 RepID=A0A336MZ86_CULSO
MINIIIYNAYRRHYKRPRRLLLLAVIIFINVGINFKVVDAQLQTFNTPPTINVDREWVVKEDEPIGSVVTRVKAQDQEQDELTFDLGLPEYYENGYGMIKQSPFTIDSTGIVKVNESLEGMGGKKFFLYVIVNDGQISAKNQVLVAIISKNSTRNSNTYRQPSFTPNTDTIKKLIPNGFYTQPGLPPPPRSNPDTNIFRYQTKTYPEPYNRSEVERNESRPIERENIRATTGSTRLSPVILSSESPPISNDNNNNSKINSSNTVKSHQRNKVPTSTSAPPTTSSQFPPLVSVILTVCGIFLIAGLIAVLMFRNYLCTISKQLKHKNKIEKAKKSNQSQISNISSNLTEDSHPGCNLLINLHKTCPSRRTSSYL